MEIKALFSHLLFVCRVENAALGNGRPMVYADYLGEGKSATMKAFQEYKKGAGKTE